MFAGLAGLLIGLAGYFAARNRNLLGPALMPAAGGISALVVWEVCTWLGAMSGFEWLAYDRGWIWWITIGVTVVVVGALALSLGRNRQDTDDELFDRLRHVGKASI